MVSRIQSLIEAIDRTRGRFPPTILYNEGWMLRLVLDWYERHHVPDHQLDFLSRATWVSEGLLPSPFGPRQRGDRRAEARTHADGIIGHINVGKAGKADVQLERDASQFVVIEAKIHSPLSGGTRNAPGYNQAARSLACIAEVLCRAERRPEELTSLAFVVAAPQANINKMDIAAKLEKSTMRSAVRSRAQAFGPGITDWLDEWFLSTLARVVVKAMSWEVIIGDIQAVDEAEGRELGRFYQKCLEYS